MDFNLTEEQRIYQNTLHNFLIKECPLEKARELEDNAEFPFEIWEKLAALGIMGLPFPEEYGGTSGSVIDFAIVCEELSWALHSVALMYVLSVLFGGEAVLLFGNEEQKKFFLPKLSRGEIRFCGCMTEPNAGSDVASLKTTAVTDGDSYVVNGSKVFTTGAHVADYALLLARTDKEAPKHKGISMFMFDFHSPGITVSPLKHMGCEAVHTNEVFLEDVRIPKDTVLGELNKGFFQIMGMLDVERIVTGAMGVGLAQRAFEYALQYSKERAQFGQPIGKFQASQHKFADMAAGIHAARLAVYQAAWLKDQKGDCPREACIAKLLGTEIAKRVTIDGLQIMGGYGYMKEYEMERFLREAILGTIVAGTSEIMKNVIAGTHGL